MKIGEVADFLFLGAVVMPASVLLLGGPIGLAALCFSVLLLIGLCCAVMDPEATCHTMAAPPRPRRPNWREF